MSTMTDADELAYLDWDHEVPCEARACNGHDAVVLAKYGECPCVQPDARRWWAICQTHLDRSKDGRVRCGKCAQRLRLIDTRPI